MDSTIGYAIQFGNFAIIAPLANSTYYFGLTNTLDTAIRNAILITKDCVLKDYYSQFSLGGSSGELSTLSIDVNNGTDNILISNAVNTSTSVTVSKTDINYSLVSGDILNIKWVTPGWTSAPFNVRHTGSLWLEII